MMKMAQENKMKKRHNKYRILKGFDTKSKAEKFLRTLSSELPKPCCKYGILERQWNGRDKKRFYVRELVKKGRKRI
jgi:hypothetical protein